MTDYEREDMELAAMMGDKFIDATVPLAEMPKEKKQAANTNPTKKAAQKPVNKAVDAQWEPAKAEPNFIEKLTDTAKWICLFGGLSFLIFYWKETGLMAESIAVPSMCVCTALVGWSIGKHAIRGNR